MGIVTEFRASEGREGCEGKCDGFSFWLVECEV